MARIRENENDEVQEKKVDKLLVTKPSVDFPVEVEATDKDVYHETGAKFEVGHKKALQLEKLDRVEITSKGKEKIKELKEAGFLSVIVLLFMMFASFAVNAQTSVDVVLKNSVYTTLNSDTVTNTGTGAVGSPRISGPAQSVTIVVVLTELSGTTAGTLTLQGSLDGTNFKAIPTEETQTSIATATALDVASQVFTWRVKNSPYLYYRVSWTGSGTMSATIAGRLMKH